MEASVARQWVVRIFNGPLQGAEFRLDAPRTLFVVGPQSALCQQERGPSIPPDALYVPLEEGAQNFEILVDHLVSDGVTLRLLGEAQGQEQFCAAQTLEQIGHLRIAVKRVEDAWSQTLLHGNPQNPPPLSISSRSPVIRMWPALLGSVLVIGLILTAGWTSRSSQASDVAHLIKDALSPSVVLHGRDDQVYVVAESERDAQWGRQMLERDPRTSRPRLLTATQESQRLGALLMQSEPDLAWYRIDMSLPGQPRLLVSRQRNLLTPDVERRLTEWLLKAAPYADSVSIESINDEFVGGLAESGLQQRALPYQRLATGPGTLTFSLQGNLGDAQLEAARRYIADFNRQWGNRYVHFAVELKDDWLKGKSFQYGQEGYVKTTPSSWHFSEPDLR